MILLNSKEVAFQEFPYAEVKLVLEEGMVNEGVNVVTFMYESDSDLIKLMFVKRELEQYYYCEKVILNIAFMPYARMDRSDDNTCFTLKYVSEFINYLNFFAIRIFEPHSNVSVALVNKSVQVELTKNLFYKAMEDDVFEFSPENDFICYPDATAYKRYSKIDDFNAIIGMKDRDFNTGWIKSLELFVPGNKDENKGAIVKNDIKGKNVVILDDLSSKGGTFILTARELKRLEAKSVTLIVAHCEPTILEGDVLKTDLIDCVITSNTILKPELVKSFDKMFVYDFKDFA